nr:iron-containing alcohol dehydrogenase [uncultured Paraglaciecola sp.]
MLFQLKVKGYQLLATLSKWLGKLIPVNNPILFCGKDASIEMCNALAQMGHKHVLLVTDEVLLKLKLADKVIAQLASQNIQISIYSGVQPTQIPSKFHRALRWS